MRLRWKDARRPLRFRTFQSDPKDLPGRRWQAEHTGVAAALPEGCTMSDRVEDGQSWASNIAWVAFYSILVLLLMLLWLYVPA